MARASIVAPRVRFQRQAPERLVAVIGGGQVALAGAVFFVPGLALMLIGFHVVPIAGEDFLLNGVPVLGLFGLPFFLVGSSLICARRWWTFDLGRRVLVRASGWLAPLFQRERSLQDFTAVTLRFHVHYSSGGEGSGSFADDYPVVLTAGAGGTDLLFSHCRTYQEAFAHASTLAAFLGVPVRDASTAHPLEIAPADLAHPVQARLRADAAAPPPAAPAMLRSQVEALPHGVRISIPKQTHNACMYALVLCVTVPSVIMILFVMRSMGQSLPPGMLYPMLGAAALIAGYSVLAMLKQDWLARRSSTVVSVDGRGIRLEARRGQRTRGMVILPIADLIDIDYHRVDGRRPAAGGNVLGQAIGSHGITLKARSGLYRFGAGLPDAEVAYLAFTIKRALSAPG